MKKPNILWICTDQQRFDTLGCYGNEYVNTPNIDRLASNSTLFEKCYTQSPVCTPSRASFLTGRYPRTTCCRQNGQSIPDREVLITKMFSDAGYICGLSGKLHLSACNPNFCKGTESRIDDGYDIFNWSHDANYNWPTNQYHLWLNEIGVKYEVRSSPYSKHVKIGMPAGYHHTTWCTNKAINFIESCASFDMPWLLSLNYFDPHAPFDPPEDYLKRYVEQIDKIPKPNYVEGELENKPFIQKLEHEEAINSSSIKISYKASELCTEDHLYIKAAYWAMIDLIDTQVGKLMDVLEKKGLLENTIVIFMSDHGELLGDHGMYYKGPFFYEPSIHVPFMISWPSIIESGKRSKALIELTDLAPTLLDAAGLKHPDGMQGKSYWDLLTGKDDLDYHRDDIYCEYYNALPWNKPGVHATMVSTERYKLVTYHNIELGELYDLREDPTETKNLWNDINYNNIKIEMFKCLCDRMAWTTDPLPMRDTAW